MSKEEWPRRAYRRWIVEELDDLRYGYGEGKTVDMLAVDHERSTGAIVSRLLQLGLVENRSGNIYRRDLDQGLWVERGDW